MVCVGKPSYDWSPMINRAIMTGCSLFEYCESNLCEIWWTFFTCKSFLVQLRYPYEPVAQGIAEQFHNPEVDVDITRPNFNVRKQIAKLRTITQQLKNAVAGRDADWIDSGKCIDYAC